MNYHESVLKLIRDTVQIERETLIHLRDTDTIGDDAMRRVERNLDLEEMRFSLKEK